MKLFIFIFSALMMSSCGKDVKDAEPNEEEMTQEEAAEEGGAEEADPEAAAADEAQDEEAPAPTTAMTDDGGHPMTDALNCSSGENSLVYELFNYGEPYPACLSDNPGYQCVCKLQVTENGGSPTIVAHAATTKDWCSRKLNDLKEAGQTSFANGRTLSIPTGYTCGAAS